MIHETFADRIIGSAFAGQRLYALFFGLLFAVVTLWGWRTTGSRNRQAMLPVLAALFVFAIFAA